MIKENKKLYKNSLLHSKGNTGFNINFVAVYTVLFMLVALFVFKDFIFGDISLVRKGDAFAQHYKALIYLSEYIREFLRNVFIEHRFIIPQFDFEVGMGSDVISTFAYYSFGDPFNILCFLFSKDKVHIYYQLMVVFRFYCAGLSFSYLCFRMGNKNYFAVLSGALTYCFSVYAIFAGLKHPYFLNPMVFLPIIVLGVENILQGKSVILMTAMVAIAEISNFYFFYILVLLTVVYVAARLIVLYKTDFRKMLQPFVKIALSSLLGVGMGAVLFIPVVLGFLSDARSESGNTLGLFYDLSIYRNMPVAFVTRTGSATWLLPCLTVLFIPCLAVLFSSKKKNTLLRVLIVLSFVFMCFPIFGKIFNGFSYASNRWCFGYILVASYVITVTWSELIKAERKQVMAVCCAVSVFALICTVCNSENNIEAIIPFLLMDAIVTVLVLLNMKKIRIKHIFVQILFLCFALISIVTYSHYLTAEGYGDYASEFTVNEKFDDISYKSNDLMLEGAKKEKEKGSAFWRYTARKLSDNAAFLDSLKSTQYYWSLSNGVISNFRTDMNVSENIPYCYEGFDARTALNSLASVKYFINNQKNNKAVPYGFSKTKVKDVYKNEYPLPFGYTYDSYVTYDELTALNNSVRKQEIMLQSAVIEEETQQIKKGSPEATCIETEYDMEYLNDSVTYKDGRFTVTSADSQLDFVFDAVSNSELYVSFIGMEYKRTDPYLLYSDDTTVDPKNLFDMKDFERLTDEEKELIISDPLKLKEQGKATIKLAAFSDGSKEYSNSFFFYNPEANFYSGRKSFDINMGYTENGMSRVRITFPYPGIYSFEEFKIIAQPMDKHQSYINKLSRDVLENVKIDYNTVMGSIDLSQNKLLCMSVPYSKGWSARVDGEKATLIRANGMYCGLLLSEGEHTIELRYRTPGFAAGAIISALSIAIFTVLIYYYAQRKNSGLIKFRKKMMK